MTSSVDEARRVVEAAMGPNAVERLEARAEELRLAMRDRPKVRRGIKVQLDSVHRLLSFLRPEPRRVTVREGGEEIVIAALRLVGKIGSDAEVFVELSDCELRAADPFARRFSSYG